MHYEDNNNPDDIRWMKGRIPVMFDPLSNARENGGNAQPEDDRDEYDDVFERGHFLV
jgi:hypothetical protein